MNHYREYLYILLPSLRCFEPMVSKLCLTTSHKVKAPDASIRGIKLAAMQALGY